MTPDQMQNLRKIRVYHWRAALAARVDAVDRRERAADRRCSVYSHMRYCREADALEHSANEHIRMVQWLNDFFPAGDSAMADDMGILL